MKSGPAAFRYFFRFFNGSFYFLFCYFYFLIFCTLSVVLFLYRLFRVFSVFCIFFSFTFVLCRIITQSCQFSLFLSLIYYMKPYFFVSPFISDVNKCIARVCFLFLPLLVNIISFFNGQQMYFLCVCVQMFCVFIFHRYNVKFCNINRFLLWEMIFLP